MKTVTRRTVVAWKLVPCPRPGLSLSHVTTASTITLTATVSDNVGVTKVEFYEGTTLLTTDTSSPYTWSISFAAANNGSHSYSAKAYDAANNVATTTAVNVVVNIGGDGDTQPPTASLASSSTNVTGSAPPSMRTRAPPIW